MHRQGTDVAAREFQRLYGIAVGGEQHLVAVQRQRNGVGPYVEAVDVFAALRQAKDVF